MRLEIALLFIFCIINAHSLIIDKETRFKRSPQDSFFGKVKTGFTNIVSDVKKITNKGVEEVKNLFSSDRKVGDYRIDQLDVRFGDDDENSTITENFNQLDNVDQVQRDKREINQEMVMPAMDDVIKNLEEQLEGQDHSTEGADIQSTTLENNAEVSPGYPPANAVVYSILYAPPKCLDGQKIAGNRCRTIV